MVLACGMVQKSDQGFPVSQVLFIIGPHRSTALVLEGHSGEHSLPCLAPCLDGDVLEYRFTCLEHKGRGFSFVALGNLFADHTNFGIRVP